MGTIAPARAGPSFVLLRDDNDIDDALSLSFLLSRRLRRKREVIGAKSGRWTSRGVFTTPAASNIDRAIAIVHCRACCRFYVGKLEAAAGAPLRYDGFSSRRCVLFIFVTSQWGIVACEFVICLVILSAPTRERGDDGTKLGGIICV